MKDLDAHLRNCPGLRGRCSLPVSSFGTVIGRAALPSGISPPAGPASDHLSLAASFWRGWLAAAAVVAGLFTLALGVTYFGRRRLERAKTCSELANLHMAALRSDPVDVVSTDRPR